MVKIINSKQRCQAALLRHVLWAAMEKIGKKELESELLEEGTSHIVSMEINGSVDEQLFSESIESLVSVGYRQQKTSSVNPQIVELVAWILSKLNRATRNRILSDLPHEFEENGMPETSKTLVDEVSHMLLKLRQTKTVSARGPVRCEYVRVGNSCRCGRCAKCDQNATTQLD